MTTRPGFSFCICPDGKLLRQQVEELLGAHPDAGRERHVFWGDDELPPKFWEILTLQGLFSTSRVLVMRNAHALTADVWKRLSAALSRPNPQTWPLFCLEVAWEKGQPKIPAYIAKLPCFTFADAKGWIWRSPGLEPRSLRRHIQIRSKALGLDLEPGCVDILAETLLPDAAAVEQAPAAGGRKTADAGTSPQRQPDDRIQRIRVPAPASGGADRFRLEKHP